MSSNATTPATAARQKKFAELDGGAKLTFIGKVLVFVITFGFAFPTILSD